MLGNPVNLEAKQDEDEAEEDTEAALDSAVDARLAVLEQLKQL